MPTYDCAITGFAIEADSPEEAAKTLVRWIEEGLHYKPVVSVCGESGKTVQVDVDEIEDN